MSSRIKSIFFEKTYHLRKRIQKKRDYIYKNWIYSQKRTKTTEPYFLIYLSPYNIHYQVIDGEQILEENSIDLLDIDHLQNILDSYTTLPVYLILKEWDISIKHLDLKETSWYNRTLIRHEFQKGEFDKKDIYICKPSSVIQGLYRFITINHNETLDQALKALSHIKNTLMGISIEEYLQLKNLLKSQNITTHLNWHILLTLNDNQWKIIVGFGKDLMLVRYGCTPDLLPHIEREHYFLREIVETIKYLKRLGLTNDEQVAFYTDPKLFKTTTLSNYGLLLVDLNKIDFFSFTPPPFYEGLLEKIKSVLKLDFYKTKFKSPYFFWHAFFYRLPQYAINGLSPIVLFSTIFCFIYGLKLSYFKHAITNIEKQMEQVQPLKNMEEQELEKSNFMIAFKKHYKKNPVLIFKTISQSLAPSLIAKSVDWTLEDDRIKITLELTEKRKHHNTKEFIEKTKEHVENMLHQTLPSFTPQWHQSGKTILILTLVGPSQ
jgi:hypothetical protein